MSEFYLVPLRTVSPFPFSSTHRKLAGIRNPSWNGRSFAMVLPWISARIHRRRRFRVVKSGIHHFGNECRTTVNPSRNLGLRDVFGLQFSISSQNGPEKKTSTTNAILDVGPEIQITAPKEEKIPSACNTHQQGTCFSSLSPKFWLLRRAAYAVIASILSVSLYFGGTALAFSDCSNLTAYYTPVDGLKAQELKSRLHQIIQGHKVVSYIQAWDALKVLDEAEDDPNSVIEIYSLKKVAKSRQAKADGWNREHLWPRSYGLVMGRPEFSDLQNLRPADVNVNSSRGNKYFGECTTSDHCLVPANREAAVDTGTTRDLWMPPAQVRGDIARALMYMAVRYGSEQSELQLSDSPRIGTAQMGFLSDILHWNEIDPPSPSEKVRNGRICQLYQHNRNPFVDHPEFAKLIWGDAVQNGPVSHSLKAADREGKNFKHYQQPKRLPVTP